MKKRFLIVLIIISISVGLVGHATAISYEEARANENLRPAYLEKILEIYPPPVDKEQISYVPKHHETGTMAVNYTPYYIDMDSPLTMSVYPNAFEEYKNEGDFISTIHHEYNHLRALSRDEILNEEKHYMEVVNAGQIQLKSNIPDHFSFDPSTVDLSINFSIEWMDLYCLESYKSHLISEEKKDSSKMAINHFIHTHLLEMLAIEEEIWLSKNKLNLSQEFEDSRYQMYANHYLEMIKGLSATDADPNLTKTLESIFYRSWIPDQIKNFNLILALYDL